MLAEIHQREEERRSSLTPAQRIAEDLHEILCRDNHDDQCGWFYESWKEPLWRYSSRRQYILMAERVLEILNGNEELARKVFIAIKRP